MKKLLLITFLFLITPDAKADMDNKCSVNAIQYSGAFGFYKEIETKCRRDNILHLFGVTKLMLPTFIADFCRFDREIHFFKSIDNPKFDDGTYTLVCVLYSSSSRRR